MKETPVQEPIKANQAEKKERHGPKAHSKGQRGKVVLGSSDK